MRNIWKGAISFGLVNIPVKLYTATESKDVKFNYLHRECKTPIKYEKICPACKKELGSEDLVRGYEYEPGKYVVIAEEDLEKIPLSTLKAIEILDFVDLAEIDPIYYVKSYYVAPGELGAKPYRLLYEAMKKSARIAIARVVLRQKESLAVLRTYRHCLVMETIFYPDEIRSPELIPELQGDVRIHENELKMALSLIENLTAPFRPEEYRNNYREALMDLIHAKVAGEEIVAPAAAEPNKVVDLMEALQASIAAAQKEKRVAAKTKNRNRKREGA